MAVNAPASGRDWNKTALKGIQAKLNTAFDEIETRLQASLKTAVVSATRAELNGASGKTLVAAVTGKKIIVTNWTARDVGGFSAATGTSCDIEDTNGTPVSVAVIAKAALTSAATVGPFSANVTRGAGHAAPLTVSKGLRAIWVGTDADAGTSITFTITYAYVD